MIDASQRMITMNNQGEELGGMSPPQKRYLALQIKTLEKAPRAEKLERLLKAKRRQKEEATYIEERHTKARYRD
jgi:hypothetical protein